MAGGVDAAVGAGFVASRLNAGVELASRTVGEPSEFDPPPTGPAVLITSFSTGFSAGADEPASMLLPDSDDATGGCEDSGIASVATVGDWGRGVDSGASEFWL